MTQKAVFLNAILTKENCIDPWNSETDGVSYESNHKLLKSLIGFFLTKWCTALITFKLTPFSWKGYALTNLLFQAGRRSSFLSPTCMEIIKLVLLLSFLRVWEFTFHLNEHSLPRKRCWPSLLVWYLELSHHPQETGGSVPLAPASVRPARHLPLTAELLCSFPWSLLLFFFKSMFTKLCRTESKNGVTTSA